LRIEVERIWGEYSKKEYKEMNDEEYYKLFIKSITVGYYWWFNISHRALSIEFMDRFGEYLNWRVLALNNKDDAKFIERYKSRPEVMGLYMEKIGYSREFVEMI
jgi:hypothetical protein